jgi:hypothetical protein
MAPNVISKSCLTAFALIAVAAVSLATQASAACTPAVYVFRHAEDVSSDKPIEPRPCLPGSTVMCYSALTELGMRHANLYLEMISNFRIKEEICPVTAVYAVSPIKPPDDINPYEIPGTANPYDTATPLAKTLMDVRSPLYTMGDLKLDEFLGNVTPELMKSTLLDHTKKGQSVAVFWTSQGLQELGRALGTSVIPKKPPRNAAYIFRYEGGSGFVPPTEAAEYVQCFNYNGNPSDSFGNQYYCGISTFLDDPKADVPGLSARICAPGAADFKKMDPSSGYHGYCELPSLTAP